MSKFLLQESGSSTARPRVLIVEDHAMLAEALALSLSARGYDCSVARLDGPESVLSQAASQRPALVLLDLDLGNTDGLDLLPGLRARGAEVLVVTGYADEPHLAACLALGAVGWVSKTQPFERLLEAAELALRGRSMVGAARHDELMDLGRAALVAERDVKQRLASLTLREREVLAALEEGKNAEGIAQQFVVSVGTVRSHIRAVLTKLGVTSQLAAVAKVRDLAVHR